MKNKHAYPVAIAIIVILLVFIVIYIFVPFTSNSFLSKIYSPLCGIKKLYQGEEYLPAWCLEKASTQPQTETEDEMDTEDNEAVDEEDNLGIANPASVKCIQDGGTSEIYQTASGGMDGLCIFADESICKEWDYFRGDCEPGDCFKECQAIGSRSEGWYNSCTGERIQYADCAEDVTDDIEEDQIEEDEIDQPLIHNIKIDQPQANDQLSSPFTISGQAIVRDNQVYVRVKSKAGVVLIEEDVTAVNQAGTEWANFSIDIDYEFSQTREGTVEVYSKDDNDEEANLLIIPVKF